MNLKAVLEGLLFVVGDEGLTIEELKSILELEEEKIRLLIEELKTDCDNENRGLDITILGNRLKMITKNIRIIL